MVMLMIIAKGIATTSRTPAWYQKIHKRYSNLFSEVICKELEAQRSEFNDTKASSGKGRPGVFILKPFPKQKDSSDSISLGKK